MNNEKIGCLLEYCSKIPSLYNEVSNDLYDRFGILSAEATLIVTYYVAEEHRKGAKFYQNSEYGKCVKDE